MERDGIKLYCEAEKFVTFAGVMIEFCHPPNLQSASVAHHHLKFALQACSQKLVAEIKKNRPEGERGSEEQKRHNFTIRQIRVDCKRFCEGLSKKLNKQVWRA